MQSTTIGRQRVWFEQSEEFHILKREVFSQHVYYTELDDEDGESALGRERGAPVIIDAGAHIGLATISFLMRWPQAKIWAIEPLPEHVALLKKNCAEFGEPAVTIIQAALMASGDEATLHLDSSPTRWWSTGSVRPGAWNEQQQTAPRHVAARQLSTLLREIGTPIDLLKMDIEGSELEVLREAREELFRVRHLILEYHPVEGNDRTKLIALLEDARFTLSFYQDGKEVNPLKAKGLFYIEATR